ncbi:flavodoxin family protein [Bdellovibrio bacteriovorus]|uniref:flavodoxin family protein n=1 Tax=Bdellovibrio bacteriovorus TaxID=959 RepID=UPI0035A64CD8
MKKILVFNGSPAGDGGNCARWVSWVLKCFKKLGVDCSVEVVHLKSTSYGASLKKKISAADGFVFVTGTYWDSWGSPLQKLLEEMTELEGTSSLMGKPCAVFVLMHSVGGKSVLSRLQGVLSTMGLLIPPMSGMVYSLVSEVALRSKSSHRDDFWQKEDALLILSNLVKACDYRVDWETWPVDKKDPRRIWLKN